MHYWQLLDLIGSSCEFEDDRHLAKTGSSSFSQGQHLDKMNNDNAGKDTVHPVNDEGNAQK